MNSHSFIPELLACSGARLPTGARRRLLAEDEIRLRGRTEIVTDLDVEDDQESSPSSAAPRAPALFGQRATRRSER